MSEDFCNKNFEKYDSASARKTWSDLFKKACEMEVAFFDTGLSPRETYRTIAPGVYTIRNAETGTVVDVQGNRIVADQYRVGKPTQKVSVIKIIDSDVLTEGLYPLSGS